MWHLLLIDNSPIPMQNPNLKRHHFYYFFLFLTTFQLVNIAIWSYYPILLYKQLRSIDAIVQDNIFLYSGIIIGFLFFSFILDRFGYAKISRVSFILLSLTSFVIFLFIGNIAEYYRIFALLIGIGHGSYWTIFHSFTLSKFDKKGRSKLMNEVYGWMLIISVVAPILSGYALTATGRYDLLFLSASAIYLFAAILPRDLGSESRTKFRGSEITAILKEKVFNRYFFTMFYHTSTGSVMDAMFKVIPFIMLGTELKVGALFSVVAVMTGVFSILSRNWNEKRKRLVALDSFILHGGTNLALAISWTTPFLILRQITQSIAQGFAIPVFDSIDYSIREDLTKGKEESAIEMNLVSEGIYFISRLTGLIILLIIFEFSPYTQMATAQIVIGALSFHRLLSYLFGVSLSK